MHLPNLRFPALRERFNRPADQAGSLHTLVTADFSGWMRQRKTKHGARVGFLQRSCGHRDSDTDGYPGNPDSDNRGDARSRRNDRTYQQESCQGARASDAAAASKAAANASAQAALASRQAATASKQAASVANQVEGTRTTGADVSLEPGPGATAAVTLATPSPAAAVPRAAPAAGTPTLNSPGVGSSAAPDDADPAKAAKMIGDVDRIETRIDRRNLSDDDSQRDILAQKLLQEAKTALTERDNVAAISLATKASTLLAPLPKLADSASQPRP